MYRPAAFDVTDVGELHDAIQTSGPAHLVSMTAAGLTASVVPLLLEPTSGEHGALVGHLARANRHWRDVSPGVESLAIFAGPDAYISPNWYATKRETGRVVPTWNYEVVHVHGELVIHDDPAWVADLVRRLTARHEAGMAAPWTVDDAPAEFVTAELRAIVGIEVRIARLEGKRKLSQNRAEADVEGAIEGLSSGSPVQREVAARMERALAARQRSG